MASQRWHYNHCRPTSGSTVYRNEKDPNILIVQTLAAFCNDFSRILRLLWNNQQFLFNRGMQEQLRGRETGSFICENEPRNIRVYASFLVNYLYSTNRVTYDDRLALQTALMELLTNALEHGNCDISFTEKTEWLFSGREMIDLIMEKNTDPEIAAKRIHISYLITSKKSYFKIKDEGKGFDWQYQMSREEDETQIHGRGIMLSQGLASNIKYNEKGNQVPLKWTISNSIPTPFLALWKPLKWCILQTNRLFADKTNRAPTCTLLCLVAMQYMQKKNWYELKGIIETPDYIAEI